MDKLTVGTTVWTHDGQTRSSVQEATVTKVSKTHYTITAYNSVIGRIPIEPDNKSNPDIRYIPGNGFGILVYLSRAAYVKKTEHTAWLKENRPRIIRAVEYASVDQLKHIDAYLEGKSE